MLDEDVRRLHVAVDDAVRVQRLQPADELVKRRAHALVVELGHGGVHGRAAAQVVDDVDAVDQLHREEALLVVDDEVVELDQVRMRQAGERAELLFEQVDLFRRVGAQGLQRHVAAEHGVVRQVDDAHPALPEGREQSIASGAHHPGRRRDGLARHRTLPGHLSPARVRARNRALRPAGDVASQAAVTSTGIPVMNAWLLSGS
ncbi:MAG: hypothetical protein U0802_13435 [Candidatus Binatia bacterium]